ncbi:glycosyltransferase [uncultured Lentibacter sp.]|uniref:glycosyltransferase n=1 Tax=uncultured Lentibacter sp. TaxID=1659309 RepID=UPI002609AE81|nr:glycosyltransferase [uncultured Lentibacter sp.]
MSDVPQPRVTIALCTYNGAQHLEAQLASYLAQTYTAWDLWISDDGSSDRTRALLEAFAKAHSHQHAIRIVTGPQKGVAANFLSLLCHPEFPEAPCALSDQDDVWLPEKLALGMAALPSNHPCLYGAQSVQTNAALVPLARGPQRGHKRPMSPSFANALVQNIVSGHSAMLNAPALALVRAAGVPPNIPYHDWWLYQLVTGAGGRIIVRAQEVLLYRQHSQNTMGANQGVRARLRRAAQLFGATYGAWLAANTAALRHVERLLTPEAQSTLKAMELAPKQIFALKRLSTLRHHGIQRHSRLGTAALWMSVLLGRC